MEVFREKDSGRLRGFAFVTFDEEDSAEKCMQRRQHEICKKICRVKRAQTSAKREHRDRGCRKKKERKEKEKKEQERKNKNKQSYRPSSTS